MFVCYIVLDIVNDAVRIFTLGEVYDMCCTTHVAYYLEYHDSTYLTHGLINIRATSSRRYVHQLNTRVLL